MYKKQIQNSGFTIVELLIVVVVIAILATITIVSFGAIQNRAHDSAVQSDLRQLGIKIKQYHAERSVYPPASQAGLGSLGFKPSTGSYGSHFVSSGSNYNFLYCFNNTSGAMALVANSRTGKSFAFSGDRVFESTALRGSALTCDEHGVNPFTNYWLYGHAASGIWATWL